MSKVNATLQYLQVSDGKYIYYQKWMPENPRAIIIFVHGLGDHCGRYGDFVRHFASNNFGVCLFDLRGHGQSAGRRMHVNRFYDFLYDTNQFIEFIRNNSPRVPIFLAGHSLGSQIVLNFVVKYDKGIRGVIASSPHIESLIKVPEWKLKVGRAGSKVFPFLRVKCDVDASALSHEKDVVERYGADPNIGRSMTLRCGSEIVKNTELVMALAGRIHLPVIFLHGSEDKICSAEATKKFFMRVPVYNKELKIYPEMYHELFNEVNRNEVFNDVQEWIEKQLGSERRLATGARQAAGKGETYAQAH